MRRIKDNILILCNRCGAMRIVKRFDSEDPTDSIFLTTKDCPSCDSETELTASPSEYDIEDDRQWYGRNGQID